MDMDIKVIEQLVEQALKEIKAEQPLKFTAPKLERYGVFKTMDEAIAASEEAQKKLLFSKISDRQKYVDVIRSTIIKRENLELISRLSVEETEIGDYEHKLIKNRLAAEKTPGTEDLMIDNPSVRLLVATGGPSIVKKVLSSGKKAIGAGAGNPPVVVDETADIDKAAKDIVDGCSFDNNVPCIAEKEVFAVDSICDYLIHHMKENGAYQITDPMLLEQLVALVTTEKGGPKTSFVGKSARYILDKLGITVDASVRVIIMEVPKDHLLVQEEMMMPILPVVRVSDVDTAIEYAHQAEHGNRHTAMMHSKNVEKLSKMAKIMETTIFVKNAPSYAGIGVGGEGYTTFTIAGPTGEGLTSPRTFCRKRKCVMTDAFSIR